MSTSVYATIDGIVKHQHGGVKGWHNPDIRHADAQLHVQERVSQPKGLNDLSEAGKAQYREALKGKSFEYLWKPGREARRAERVASGGPEFLHHGAKGKEAVKEAEAILADPIAVLRE